MLGDIDEIKFFISVAFFSMHMIYIVSVLLCHPLPLHQYSNTGFLSTWKKYIEWCVQCSGWITLFYFPIWNWKELKMWNTNNANLVGRHRCRAGGRLYVRWTWKANIANEKFLEIGVKPFLCCMCAPISTWPGWVVHELLVRSGHYGRCSNWVPCIKICQCKIN